MNRVPRTRRVFRNAADELNYLNLKISYWWHQRGLRTPALRFCNRFEELLQKQGRDDKSIALQDHWGMLHEVRGNLEKAIAARERETTLIERLLHLDGPVGPIDHEYLVAALVLLAGLHHQAGNFPRSLELLRKAGDISSEHSLSFPAKRILEELTQVGRASSSRQPA